MKNKELNTIPEKESDEFIKSSDEDLVPILSESEDTFGSDSDDDESLSDENVPEDNVKIYSNLLFEYDDEYIYSDVNPLFNEVLEDIECKDSYDSNLDESNFLVTPLSNSTEDEYFTPGDDVELLLYRDPSISVASILEGFTDKLPFKENGDLFDLEFKNDKWKKILHDALIDYLMTEDKVIDPGIHDQIFSLTYGENGCDVPACFTTFLNVLFDVEYEFDSSDNQSLSDENFSNPLFEEEIISMKIDPHRFNAKSDLIESLLNHDSFIIPPSSKIDSLLDEFAGELTLLKSIP
nr:hypothetical protein [Tanacetum cinerariifolium]